MISFSICIAGAFDKSSLKMAKVQRKQRTCKLRGNILKLTTTVTAVHKCIYLGSQ